MELKYDKSFWKGILIGSILMPIFIYLITNYAIEPYLNPDKEDMPVLEIIKRDPKSFEPGDEVLFNVTIENSGKKTASELLIRAYTDDYEGKKSFSHKTGYSKILQAGEYTYAEFEFTAPDNYTKYPEWTMMVVATTTDGYKWDFYIEYVYESEYEVYHIKPRNS